MEKSPIHLKINGDEQVFTSPCSLLDLLHQMQIFKQEGLAIALNDEVIPKSRYQNVFVKEKDRIEIIHAIGGG